MKRDDYKNVRSAFHVVADGLMDWKDPPERAESPREATRALREVFLPADVLTLESAAESLVRLGDIPTAITLWALALRVRMETNQ